MRLTVRYDCLTPRSELKRWKLAISDYVHPLQRQLRSHCERLFLPKRAGHDDPQVDGGLVKDVRRDLFYTSPLYPTSPTRQKPRRFNSDDDDARSNASHGENPQVI